MNRRLIFPQPNRGPPFFLIDELCVPYLTRDFNFHLKVTVY